jgi:hypothetical protein
MKRTLAAVLLFSLAAGAMALPPKVEADKQMMAASSAMKAGEWREAVQAFKGAEATGVSLPEVFDYLYGTALNENAEYAQAAVHLERYLTVYGAKGKFYTQALEQMNKAEKLLARKKAQEEAAVIAARAAERNASMEKAWLDSRWRRGKTTYWVNHNYGNTDCEDTQSRTEARVKELRNFDCSCASAAINHPAFPGQYATTCKATWEGNLHINNVETFNEDTGISKSERLEIWTYP